MKKTYLKIYISLSTAFFLLAILTLAFHYERYAVRLAGCSICNIKNFTSLSVQKVKSDPLTAMAVDHPLSGEVLSSSPEILLREAEAYIPSLLCWTLFNKAPPVIS